MTIMESAKTIFIPDFSIYFHKLHSYMAQIEKVSRSCQVLHFLKSTSSFSSWDPVVSLDFWYLHKNVIDWELGFANFFKHSGFSTDSSEDDDDHDLNDKVGAGNDDDSGDRQRQKAQRGRTGKTFGTEPPLGGIDHRWIGPNLQL